jgi:hypothetical protein
MKRSSRPRKTANLSELLHQHLNMYAAAAGAAGVSVLALTQSAEGRIVYTPAHHVIKLGNTYHLDLNHDGTTDFKVRFHESCPISICIFTLEAQPAVAGNAVDGKRPPGAFALSPGARIGAKSPQLYSSALMFVTNSGSNKCYGYWCNVRDHFLGLTFKIKGKTHYGWARLNANSQSLSVVLTGYAYETIPGKSIKAGQTHGRADDPTNAPDFANPDDPGPGAFLTNPVPDNSQPASLGMLALGAQGVALWRQKENEWVLQVD